MGTYIVWFRRDLRIADNPALFEAAKKGKVLPLYIYDENDSALPQMGSAQAVWLHHSLASLNQSLDGHLRVLKGDPLSILVELVSSSNADGVYWNRNYSPHRVECDTDIKQALEQQKLEVKSFNGSLLWEPWQVLKQDETPYKVFTPFYKKGCQSAAEPRRPLGKPDDISFVEKGDFDQELKALDLLPEKQWAEDIVDDWQMGEEGARARWAEFADNGIDGYKKGRDFPNRSNVSRLSPYLAFGEISPHQIWAALEHQPQNEDVAHFRSELAWREFSYYLLYHFPTIVDAPFNQKFEALEWVKDHKALEAWQRGRTGIPIVDAGMRELWQTGYMHNRVRMIVASFLTKNLQIDWREGAKWFEHCLFDADLANNRASWQWVAGSGADAAPYFRVFNPVLQAQKFDPTGDYIRQYVPEIAGLDDKHIAAPFDAPKDALEKAKIALGETYPNPIVDLKASRNRALDAYQDMKKANEA